MKELLLLSGSSYQSSGYLIHTRSFIANFLSQFDYSEILFIPYAGVRLSYDDYEKKVKDGLNRNDIISIHHFKDPQKAILNAKVFLIGGGNTFVLLHKMQILGLLPLVREKVEQGIPYIGWSAGANLAGKTIMTTNDMPICTPSDFGALNLFAYQINPHFISGKINGHNGESREERLQEYFLLHPKECVFALPEGSMLRISGEKLMIWGFENIKKITYPLSIEILELNKEYQI